MRLFRRFLLKQPEGNTLEVTRKLDAALEELAPGLQGVEVDSPDGRNPRTANSRGASPVAPRNVRK